MAIPSESGEPPIRPLSGASRRWHEQVIQFGLAVCATVSVLTTILIVVVLVAEALPFFAEVSPVEFLFGLRWSPSMGHLGVLELFSGTLLVTFGAVVVAAPLGLGAAIYLSEYASRGVREIVKPVLEILAGIPSVVYGYLALSTISPMIKTIFPTADFYNAASASIVVGFMILPMVVSLSEDSIRAVPRSLREGAYALGATKFDVTGRVVVPAALSGIVASFLLAISRAIGETMAVTLAAGQVPNLTLNPLESIQTMTAYIVNVRQGDTEFGTLEYRTIFAVGLTLFVTTMALNIVAQWVLDRMREQYE